MLSRPRICSVITGLLFFSASTLVGYGQSIENTEKVSNQIRNDSATSFHKRNFSYTIYKNPEGTFGYEIYSDEKKLINQHLIPGRQGSKGFAKRKDAVNVAKLVIEKLKKGLFPPTVNEEDLQKLKI